MFFNKMHRLVFGENRDGKFLAPSGALLENNAGFPSAVTEFDQLEKAEIFAHSILKEFDSEISATIRNVNCDEYMNISK